MNSGIYLIRCNDYVYVGQSSNLSRRKRDHFNYLRKNEHHNTLAQNLFVKYGEDSFTFSIAIYCDVHSLTFYEQNTYNIFSKYYKMMNFGKFTDCAARGMPNVGASEAMTKRHNNPEFKAKTQERGKLNYQCLKSPHALAQYKKSMFKYWANPNTLTARKVIMTKVWQNPKFVEMIKDVGSKVMIENWKNPEFAENVRKRMILQNADESFTKNRLSALAEKHKDVEFKKRRAELSAIKTRKEVIFLESGEVYPSITEASKLEGWTQSKIKHHLAGNVKNVVWAYK